MCHSRLNSGVTPKRSRRDAYTLLEMLIVLAIMASTVSLSWPAVRNSLAKSRLRHAARQVQTTINKLRAQAIRSGTTQMLRYQEQGHLYQVTTPKHLEARKNSVPLSDSSTTQPTSAAVDYQSRELPPGIHFAPHGNPGNDAQDAGFGDAPQAQPLTAQTLTLDPESVETDSATWSQPIVCYPTGRTSDAVIVLVGKNGFAMRLQLRGLTGIVTCSGPSRRQTTNTKQIDSPSNPASDPNLHPSTSAARDADRSGSL